MTDSGSPPGDDELRWRRLTEKQRACLDLLLEHKTSKEIARILDIAKPTVDQRLTNARDILGASSRSEAAVTYSRLKRIYDRITYDSVGVPPATALVRSTFPDGSPTNLMDLHGNLEAKISSGGASPFGDLFRHDYRSATRVGIILAVMIALLLIPLGSLGISRLLTDLTTR